MKRLVSEHVENSKLYPPGRPIEEVKRKYGIEEVVKLNSNENCLGPSPMALKAVTESVREIYRYPDNSAFYLKRKLAEKNGVSPEQIILGNGSNELVQFIIMTFLVPGEEVVTGRPTFLLYGIMGRVLGGRVKEIPLKDFSFDLESMATQIAKDTKLIFISNPNNPTGTIVTDDSFRRFMGKVPGDVIVVMDEAYFEYVTSSDFPESLEYVNEKRNIIILRTFSKAYGLAGLRIGYAIAPARLTSYMERIREPFNANCLAQKAALAALDDTEHVERTRENNRIGLEYIYAQLKKLQLSFVPTQANFLLVNVGPKADTVYRMLLKEGIMVRSMSSFEPNEHIRVTVGLPEENKKLLMLWRG
jgi:histidinol-phosphate aminotransferase